MQTTNASDNDTPPHLYFAQAVSPNLCNAARLLVASCKSNFEDRHKYDQRNLKSRKDCGSMCVLLIAMATPKFLLPCHLVKVTSTCVAGQWMTPTHICICTHKNIYSPLMEKSDFWDETQLTIYIFITKNFGKSRLISQISSKANK